MLESISKQELFVLLEAAIDGIDGFESETGYLRYWNVEKITQARRLIDAVAGDSTGLSVSQDHGSDIPRQR